MNGFIGSLALGFAVAAIYGLGPVRAPAPPLIALVGLLGTVAGEGTIDLARHIFHTPVQEMSRPLSDAIRVPHGAPSAPSSIL